MINLQTIIDGLEMVDDMNRVFLDTETNDTVYLSEFDPSLTADTAELMEQHPSRFIPLPTQREINEYGMMEDFVEELPDGDQKYTLAVAISGRGAFRRFKDTVARFDLEDKWYAYRERCYARVARRWCEDNDVEYFQKGKGVSLEEVLEDIAEDKDEPVDIVKIDAASLNRAGGAKELLKNLFGAEVEHVADEEITEEEAANSLSPAQAIKLMFLHKQMTRLKEGLASLAKDVPASLGEVLTSCSEDVSAALNRLEQEIGEVEILAEDEQVEKLEEIVELLKKHAKGTDQATTDTDAD